MKRIFWKYENAQTVRWFTITGFSVLVFCIGLQFTIFVGQIESGRQITMPRPPGVEAFLPIGALISLKYWAITGIFNKVHPAGLVILFAAMASALIVKRGFCSWVCPIGLFSELLASLRKRLFARPPVMPDLPNKLLRSAKYVILFFFIFTIFKLMDIQEIGRFINSPYNKISDVKMLKFFTTLSFGAGFILFTLIFMSVLFENFWCRFLCPYGALLGILGLPSLFKIYRNKKTCTNCQKCTDACPSRINVHKAKTVLSLECTACFKCIDACPVKSTLKLAATGRKGALSAPLFAVLMIALFAGASGVARAAGFWKNDISVEEYRFHLSNIALPYYQCNRGSLVEYSGFMNSASFVPAKKETLSGYGGNEELFDKQH